ncbi:MAG: hypothetical protein AAF063_32195 [Cyanobacteria bacterium J06643_5]
MKKAGSGGHKKEQIQVICPIRIDGLEMERGSRKKLFFIHPPYLLWSSISRAFH